MKGIRLERLAEEVRQGVSEILRTRASDPRLSLVAVTRVDLSADLSHATVMVSALGDEATQEASLRVLSRAQGFIRSELARRLRVRRLPELRFRADPGIRYSIRLHQILRDLGMSSTDVGEGPGEHGSAEGASAGE